MNELLTAIRLFHPVSPEAQQALLSICREQQFKKGATIQDIDHTCKTIYFIKSGAVRIYYFKDATDITESFEFENAFVARAESLFTGKPSRKAIQALENTSVVAIDANKLFLLFDAMPDLERMFRKIIESAYVTTVNRLESLQFYSAEQRYKILLAENPDVIKRVPLKHIASFLGITQVSLSRIRSIK